MSRLFTFTISEDKKQSDFEGEQIVRVSFKCNVCKAKHSYTANDYSNFIDEISHFINQKDDFYCSCKYNQLVSAGEITA